MALILFISYKKKDARDFAVKLNGHLKDWQHQPWLDTNDIPKDALYPYAIRDALKAADYVLGVITPSCFVREVGDYVIGEWEAARVLKKLQLLHVQDSPELKIFPPFNIQEWIDLREFEMGEDGESYPLEGRRERGLQELRKFLELRDQGTSGKAESEESVQSPKITFATDQGVVLRSTRPDPKPKRSSRDLSNRARFRSNVAKFLGEERL